MISEKQNPTLPKDQPIIGLPIYVNHYIPIILKAILRVWEDSPVVEHMLSMCNSELGFLLFAMERIFIEADCRSRQQACREVYEIQDWLLSQIVSNNLVFIVVSD
jgi:hypothetical protein